MSRILLAASLLLALAGAAMAAEVRLGLETALTPVGALGAAAYAQFNPAVASNGNDFLAVWTDARRGRRYYDIYASRIGRDGQSKEPAGRLIAENSYAAVIASAGGDYLVAYSSNAGLMTQRLDQHGGTRFFLGHTLWKFGSCSPHFISVEISGAPLDTGQPSPPKLFTPVESSLDSLPLVWPSAEAR
jgi:hypothetical protein